MKIRRSVILFCATIVALMVFLVLLTKKPGQPVAPLAGTETVSVPPAEQAEKKTSQHESRLNASTNAVKTEVVRGADLPAAPSDPTTERARQGLAALNNEDVVFYGKVTDQFDALVVGATVTGYIQVNDGTRAGTDEIRRITDNDGMFSVSGYKGKALSITVSKPGYVMATAKTRFVYSLLWAESERYTPDPNNPVVVKVWKLQGAEPLAGINQRYQFPYTGEPVTIDLLAGKIVPSGGDLRITVNRSAGVVSERTLQDWSVQVEAVNGGLIRADFHDARVAYSAPANGYQPSDTFIMSTNPPHKWFGGIDQMYFLKSRSGQVYSKVNFSVGINQMPKDDISVELSGVANTNGSRNWEATAQTSTP